MRGGGNRLSSCNKGFTLAEVLITLGIIGVIAALTIPAVITHYRKQEVIARLKKFYSTFNNALLASIAENEAMEYWEYPAHQNSGEEMDIFVRKYLFPYFKGLKNYGSKEAGCKDISKYLYSSQPVYIFTDGSCFSMLKGGGDTGSGLMHIRYDVNCAGKPNKDNHDIFGFTIRFSAGTAFIFKPGSTSSYNLTDRNELLKNCKNEDDNPHSDASCAALIYFDGWEISKDYPYKI